MFPMDENFINDYKLYHKKFYCPDLKDLRVFGTFSTERAQLMNVQFIKCHDRPDCKKPEEIDKILRNKFIISVYN